jgi:hypothetical protein
MKATTTSQPYHELAIAVAIGYKVYHTERQLLRSSTHCIARSVQTFAQAAEPTSHLAFDLLLLADGLSLHFCSFALGLAGGLFCCTFRF